MPAEQLSFLDGIVVPDRSEHGNVLIEELERWLERDAPGPTWAEGYWILRKKGVPGRDAALVTWLSLGKDDRGEFDTREKFAQGVMGVSRATTYDWEAKRPEVREWAEFLLMLRMRGSRLAEVDEATYGAAVSK
jgi:hypothetical protein